MRLRWPLSDDASPRRPVLWSVLVVTVMSVVASEALCLALYAVLGVSARGNATLSRVLIFTPILVPAIIAPGVSWPMVRSRQKITQLLDEVTQVRENLEAEVAHHRDAQNQLEHLAAHDALTGLLNRRGFFQAQEAMPVSDREVLVFDVDDFKRINDRLGHSAGDTALRAVSEVLSRVVGPAAVVGRLGGDEFAAVLPSIDDAGRRSIREALRAVPVNLGDDSPTPVSTSVGNAHLSPDSHIDEALAIADRAMYAAKRRRSALLVDTGPVAVNEQVGSHTRRAPRPLG
jgi:diguanylate cyclase (GGDEF)-like protein